mmetsp:Transcript_30966/g.75504  ORF Transcript_30966/g.75504 Transcript_30966/m.75504 type:complete len:651 (-) Transcript_30966:1209-3161(-)
MKLLPQGRRRLWKQEPKTNWRLLLRSGLACILVAAAFATTLVARENNRRNNGLRFSPVQFARNRAYHPLGGLYPNQQRSLRVQVGRPLLGGRPSLVALRNSGMRPGLSSVACGVGSDAFEQGLPLGAKDWTVDHVSQWLWSYGVKDEVIQILFEQGIDGPQLLQLCEQGMRDVGLKRGERNHLRKAVSSLKGIKEVSGWSELEVQAWARSIDMPPKIIETLRDERIDGDTLQSYDIEAMASDGLNCTERMLLYQAVCELRSLDPIKARDLILQGFAPSSTSSVSFSPPKLPSKLALPPSPSPEARVSRPTQYSPSSASTTSSASVKNSNKPGPASTSTSSSSSSSTSSKAIEPSQSHSKSKSSPAPPPPQSSSSSSSSSQPARLSSPLKSGSYDYDKSQVEQLWDMEFDDYYERQPARRRSPRTKSGRSRGGSSAKSIQNNSGKGRNRPGDKNSRDASVSRLKQDLKQDGHSNKSVSNTNRDQQKNLKKGRKRRSNAAKAKSSKNNSGKMRPKGNRDSSQMIEALSEFADELCIESRLGASPFESSEPLSSANDRASDGFGSSKTTKSGGQYQNVHSNQKYVNKEDANLGPRLTSNRNDGKDEIHHHHHHHHHHHYCSRHHRRRYQSFTRPSAHFFTTVPASSHPAPPQP